MGYYQGDPGFFSLVKTIGSAAAGMIPGVGQFAGKLVSKLPIGGQKAVIKAGQGILKHPVLSAAGAAGAVAGTGVLGAKLLGGSRGKHPSARHLHALAMGLKRARPRMNVTNVHALRRALRRTHGFAKLAMRTIHLVHPKKHARFGGFKKRRKK